MHVLHKRVEVFISDDKKCKDGKLLLKYVIIVIILFELET